MKTNFALASGGVCGPNRIKITARTFVAAKGSAALTAFLQATAGVSRVADVAESDRFRVNAAMRAELQYADASTTPLHKALSNIGAAAFAKLERS